MSIRTPRMVRVALIALAFAMSAEIALSGNAGAALAQSAAATMAPTMSATMAGTAQAALTCDKAAGLNLYAAMGYDTDIAKIFTDKTGIPVNVVDDSTGNILAKITAEGTNPQWDVTWFDGDAAMQALDDQGLLLHWDTPNIGNFTDLGKKVLPASHAYYPTGITAAAAIIYNTTKIPTAGLPKDWTDLLNPAYKDLIAESNPTISGPSYQFIASIATITGGIDQAKAFFTKLKANGLKVVDTAGPGLTAITSGDREFAIVQDAGAYANIYKGDPLAIIYPTSGVGVLPSAIGIAAKGQHQGCAEAFVNYILSADGQNDISNGDPAEGDRYYVPVISGVTQKVKRQTDGINWVYIDIPTYAKAANDYKSWFRDNIVP